MDDKDKKEQIKAPLPSQSLPGENWEKNRKISAGEQRVEFRREGEPVTEKREISKDEKIVADELRREIELMEVEGGLKEQAKKKAQEIEFLGEKEKIEHLLKIAREKGVVFAIKIAKEMKDAYILDTLHDILAREGYYKKLGQSAGDNNDDDNKT
ncbi:MAG: hypothetical protein A2998_02710 [Candidatus Staskawiczbacteria bacterium RIFCSPLOWO2_01_FULL_37_25b]|uniref:Uncharacterized protein n=1 Tax=Candidatus Staskawiczbacteria bacterium RIFCSPLOWO2_01_FULL_37_25b TaxID=1802213 RepID=A0A1G2I9M1_9BACT|nr:MAG: hypothetical protein A2998_02710 [Candidatus Staskawiczbacteria bacterium RIFCSPLOWO2_01_FULL_37_25b]